MAMSKPWFSMIPTGSKSVVGTCNYELETSLEALDMSIRSEDICLVGHHCLHTVTEQNSFICRIYVFAAIKRVKVCCNFVTPFVDR